MSVIRSAALFPLDLLLGAEFYGILLKESSLTSSLQEHVALDTIFGWVVTGRLKNSIVTNPSLSNTFFSTEISLDASINRFWELEEVPSAPKFTAYEMLAELIYETTLNRTKEG